ncbi:uncharacterized protein LOC105186111 [Harpegnathos saltator]|uniref:uncharacterized protein LOC105186111 n=1 Tax=Harpegnathos saltator TaxID=610380 RepID=UPI000591829D|nr:uncharacterized protein LOC105186111 [Harpegnathos saltator]
MSRNVIELQRKRLMDAFQCDCQTLLTRFELTYNTHFQNFCEIWREMQFSLIFECQPSEIILRIFYENALHITKQFMVNASNLKERIGALYLMYSVYYMVTDKAKFRMTLSDWKCLMDLHQKVKVEEYLDANYILCKLIVDRAFIHCLSDIEYGIEKHSQKNMAGFGVEYNLMAEIKELAAPWKLLSTINDLSKIYEEKKHILFNEEEISSVQLYNSKMADDIIKSIRTMQSKNTILSTNILQNTCSDEPIPSTSTSTSESALASASTSSSMTSVSTSDSQNSQLRNKKRRLHIQRRKKLILAKIGNAFETALQSESEEETHMEIDSDIDPLEGV